MSLSSVTRRVLRPSFVMSNVRAMSDKKESSGGAGSVRAAGGKFAERESAFENEYFYKEQQAQLQALKKHLHDEITHHEAEIKRHQEAIERHKKKSSDLEKPQK